MLIQRNVNGSNAFNRSWAEFKVGFNDTRGNYWLGNDRLSQLTQSGRYKLRFDLRGTNGNWYWAQYSSFVVSSEANSYRLQVSGYSGNAGHDSLDYNNGNQFATYDRDNNNNCAKRNRGGFWYNNCAYASVNAAPGSYDGFRWYNIRLRSTRMWLIC